MDEQTVLVAQARGGCVRSQPDAIRFDLDLQLRAPLKMETPAHRLRQHNASRCIDREEFFHGNKNANWHSACQSLGTRIRPFVRVSG